MSPAETVTALMEALESGDFDRAASYLADDFVFAGITPTPMNREQFLKFMDSLRTAFPDWSFNLHGMQEQGNSVMVALKSTGTHTGELVMSMSGLPAIPATGRCVSLPDQPTVCSLRGGQIAAIDIQPVPGGDILGILQQLGVQLPIRTV